MFKFSNFQKWNFHCFKENDTIDFVYFEFFKSSETYTIFWMIIYFIGSKL